MKDDMAETPVLRISGLSATYGFGRRAMPILHHVDMTVRRGRTMGVVGESGSGKSTLAKVIVGMLKPTSGTVEVSAVDLGTATSAQRRGLRRQVQMIPQDPYASLDPRMTIEATLLEAIAPRGGRPSVHADRVVELLEMVALPADVATRYPHEFSGGQRQRVAIARALAVEPALLIADEVTSALDASIQFEVLELLDRLQAEHGFGCVFITHNLGVAARMCDELTVMRFGRVVEQGTISLLADPQAPYTQLLVDSVPDPEGKFLSKAAVYSA